MARLCQRVTAPWSFGDLAILGFVLVQVLDGALTYAGVRIWGPEIEANPLIASAITSAGPGMGLASAKLMAVACGFVLHVHQTHGLVVLLTAFYVAAAIVPWTALFLTL
jgi:hypothetical protein